MSKRGLWFVGIWGISLLTGCIPKDKDPGPGVLTLWLNVPAEARAGETIRLQLLAKNTGGSPLKFILGGRPAHDFIVTKPDGTEVWRWSHGQTIQDILEEKTLNPGEELEFVAEWKQQDNQGQAVPPGKYLVRGLLNLEPPKKMETEPKSLVISQ